MLVIFEDNRAQGANQCMLICWPRLPRCGPLVFSTLDVVCWACHNNQNMEWSLTRGLFDTERGISLRSVTKRGTLRKKGDFPKLSRWKGGYLA